MSDIHTEHTIRADRAKAMLGDKLFQEVMQTVEDAYIGYWRRATDPAVREQAWHALKSIEHVRTELQSIADNQVVTAFNKRLR
jgi:hypothetical protein